MIIQEKIEERRPIVKEAVEELFEIAYRNQSHPQDLLLIMQHGFYKEDNENVTFNGMKCSPFVIGLDLIGHALRTNQEFYHWYMASHLINYAEFSHKLKEKEAQKFEKITIHIEKTIYLKFWESDMLLKEIYQLSELALGKSYDWFMTIPNYERDGSKQELIRIQIRDKIKLVAPKFYALIKQNYKTQLRNAIAHSQYSFLSRRIQYLNFSTDVKAHCPISNMTFEEWGDVFHDTILLYDELLSGFNKYREVYHQRTMENNNSIEIRITKQDSSTQLKQIGVRKGFKAWAWRENLNK